MKKLLALVLALVMTLGLATVGANATFADQDLVDKSDFSEAITVLNGMKVFRGDENGKFNPDDPIDRASTAAMIYRLYTGDVTDDQTDIYAGYGHFTDLTKDWYKGYIGYCANAEFIKGDGTGHFNPDDNVTGYQALAMVLRAMGYNKQNDFTGDDWELRVAEIAQQRGLVQEISATTLKAPASRALVAEILWEAAWAATVTYTPALGYSWFYNNGITGTDLLNASLGWKNFRLAGPVDTLLLDNWGRPGYVYYRDVNGSDTWQPATEGVYATFLYDYSKQYWNAVAECDVAHDTRGTSNATTTYTVFINGNQWGDYIIQPLDTVNKIGAQGRLTEVYYNYNGRGNNIIVMIDTFLAQVTAIADATYDANNHLRTPSMMRLNVYTGDTRGVNTDANFGVEQYIIDNGSINFTSFTVGQYVLLNAYTNGDELVFAQNPVGTRAYQDGWNVLGSAGSTNAGAAEALRNTANGATFATTAGLVDYWELDDPTEITGAQTRLHYNESKHTIADKVYNDSLEFHLNEAQAGNGTYTWLLDTQGNVIGSVANTAYTYGVIKSMWWAGNATDGSGVAKAVIVKMDGTEETIDISRIRYADNAGALNGGGTNAAGGAVANLGLLRADDNAVAMEDAKFLGNQGLSYFAVSTSAQVNAIADGTAAAEVATKGDVIEGNLFRFTKLANGTMLAEEVNSLDGVFADGQNLNVANQTITKNLAQNGPVLINSATQFLVRTAAGTFKAITGFENIDTYLAAEVDYVVGANGFARFVYVLGTTGAAVANTLFYNTTPAYTYDTVNGVYVFNGFVDGAEGTITTANLAIANEIQAAGAGKAWVLTKTNGVVTAIVDIGSDAEGWTVTYNPVTGTMAYAQTDYAGNADTDFKYATDVAFNVNALGLGNNNVVASHRGDTRAINGNVLSIRNEDTATTVHYNINGVTPLYGTWADLANPNGAEVVLFYKQVGTQFVVTQAYVYAILPGYNSIPAAATVNINIRVNIVNKDSGATVQTLDGTYTVVNNATTTITYLQAATKLGVNTTLLNAWGIGSMSVTVANGAVTGSTNNNDGDAYGAAGNMLIFEVYYQNAT